MKQTILMAHNYYQIPGGEDTVVANEKKMLEDNGHKVILYTRSNNELKTMGPLRKLLLPFTTIYNPRTAKDIKKIIKKENVDIVHVHNTLNLISPAVYYAALKMKKPVVQTVHNFRLLCPGATFYRDGHICEDCVTKGLGCALKHSCYRGSKAQTLICVISALFHRMTGIYGKINYICLTEFNKKKLLNLKQIKENRIFIKPNFVESTDKIIPAEDRENQFVFAGRLDKLKGIDILLETWKKIEGNTSKLIIFGTGPLEEWCKTFITENRCDVEVRGFVSNEEVKRIISKSRAVILPTQWYEGFPMIVVESFAAGTPVICSDLGNVGCLIDEEVTGRKFKSIDELIIKIKKTMTPDIYQNVYLLYLNYYTKDKNYESLTSIYDIVKCER